MAPSRIALNFESLAVGISYRFSSNSRSVLGGITRQADAATAALDRLSESFAANERVSSRFLSSAQRMTAGLEELDRGFVSVERSAMGATDRVVLGNRAMAASFTSLSRSASGARASMASAYAAGSRGSAAADVERGALAGGAVRGAGGAAAGGMGAGTIGGLVALATTAVGVRGASTQQDAETQTGIAMGRSNQFIAQTLRPIALRMSQVTAQSITDSTDLLRVMATSGLNDPKEMAALAIPIAKFADTQFLKPGSQSVPFSDSAKLAVGLAHQLGARTAKQLNPILDTLFRISNDMPDSLKTAATQLKYYAPQFRNAGVSSSEILQLQATAGRMGLSGGRSGTGFRALLSSMQRPSNGPMEAAQRDVGILDTKGRNRFINERTGAFDVEGMFGFLNRQSDQARRQGRSADFNKNLQGISTSGAGSVLALFTSDAGRQQREAVRKTLVRVGPMEAAQQRLMGTLSSQTKLLTSNFGTLATTIAQPLIGPLTNFVSALAKGAQAATNFFTAHQTATKFAAGGLALGSAAGIYGLSKMAGKFLFGHLALHGARESVGLGGWMRFGRHGAGGGAGEAGGFLERIGGALRDTLSFKVRAD